MKSFAWKKEYELGVEEVDLQHKKLVSIINDVHEGWKEGVSEEGMERIVDRLIDYTQYHFECEEKMMEEHGYPHLENHKMSHEAFISMISNFKNVGPSPDVAKSLYDFLRIWLTSHIMASDRAYVPYVKESLTATTGFE